MVLHEPIPLRLGAVAIDLDDLTVHAQDRRHALTRLEGDLLAHLAAHRGSFVTREALLSAVWRYHPRVHSRAVDHAVWRVRRKIEPDPSEPRWLTSRRGRGYRLEREGEETRPTLIGPARSARTRIVRVVCAELGVDVDWVESGLGDAPLLTGPVLLDGSRTLVDPDNICAYLVERHGRDPLGVRVMDWRQRNRIAVIREALDANRQWADDVSSARDALVRALGWLDGEVWEEGAFGYVEACLVALWEAVCLSGRAAPTDAPRVAALAEALADRPSLASTRPSR